MQQQTTVTKTVHQVARDAEMLDLMGEYGRNAYEAAIKARV